MISGNLNSVWLVVVLYSLYNFCIAVATRTNGYMPCGTKSMRGIAALDCYVGEGFSESGTLPVFLKGGQILICSLVSRETSKFPTSFWMQDISLDINERNSFYFYYLFTDN